MFVQFQWPQDPDFWALACTGAQFLKNYLDGQSSKKHQKWDKRDTHDLQNDVRRLKKSIWKSIEKKTFKKSAPKWASALIGESPTPTWVSEGSALLGAILVRIPFKLGQMANQSAAALG